MIDTEKDSLSEGRLAHYGVKGMKWGVRKDPLSRADRKAANANLKKQLLKYERASEFLESPISKKTYASLSTEDATIKKGAEIVRVTTRKNEKLRDITYATASRDDQNAYRALIPSGGAFRNTRKDYNTSYEHVFEATKTLRGPSEKARVDAFIDLLDTPSIETKNGTMITGRDYLAKNGFKREARQLDSTRLGLAAYKAHASQQTDSTPINSAYFNTLKNRGYSFVADDNDRGILSKDPLILMDVTGNTIRPKSVRQLTRQEVADAQKSLRLPSRSGVHK